MATPFSPPLYEQRDAFVVDYVRSHRPRKVVDLGCSECRLLKKLKFHRHGVQHLVGVDLDGAVLTRRKCSLAPLVSEYLQPAQEPLTIELYQGSVTQRDPRTRGFHLATCVELVEHLEPPEVEMFAEMLFGFMAPGAVIVTTPNVEFNPLLPGLRGFRNHDHKFEWTRAEFQAWARGVCWRFGYSVEFSGVGVAAPPCSGVGFCTQIAVFHKNLHQPQRSVSEHLEPSVYKLLYRVTYPSLSENNIYQKVLIGEVLFEAQNLRQDWLRTENTDPNNSPLYCGPALSEASVYQQGGAVCVPLARVWSSPRVRALCGSEQRLRQELLTDSRVKLSEDGAVMILPRDEGDDDEEEEEEGEKEDVKVTSCKVETREEDWDEELGT